METFPRILSVATAVPPYKLRQDDVQAAATRHFSGSNPSFERLKSIYANAQIETRYSCVPLDWYGREHGFAERNALYLANALELLEDCARRALDEADLTPPDVGGLVVVSSTGIATPGLDALLMERLDIPRDALRLPIFGLGCVGGVLGLARASELVRAVPERRILLLVVELCGLTFRANDFSKSNIVATALFGDGAGAVVVAGDGDGPAVVASGEHTWPNSLGVMGWDVRDDGLAVVFSRDIPTLVRTEMGEVARRYLARQGLCTGDIDDFVCHPGGAKVVSALEEVFELPAGHLRAAWEVLRRYGNMSAATILFVLKEAMAAGPAERRLLSALGPGFTVGFLTLEERPH